MIERTFRAVFLDRSCRLGITVAFDQSVGRGGVRSSFLPRKVGSHANSPQDWRDLVE